MLSILLPCRTFTVVFRCLISFLQKVSYSVQTHSLHCYLHAVYTLTLSYLHCHICLISFLQIVSYSELTHFLHCYLHAVYSLTLSYLHCCFLMLNFIPSDSKLFRTDSLSALLLTCCLFSYPVLPSLLYFDA